MILYFSKAHFYIADSNQKDSCPKLEFTSPLFRRRLSQLTKMTVQVIHDLIEEYSLSDVKQIFISNRGELKREFSINEELIKDSEIRPASFSLSVFNTAIAQTTLALKLKAGYSVIFPSQNNFYDALQASFAPILCGDEKSLLVCYADECIPDEYTSLTEEKNQAMAFAFYISLEKKEGYKEIEISSLKDISPLELLEKLK